MSREHRAESTEQREQATVAHSVLAALRSPLSLGVLVFLVIQILLYAWFTETWK